MKLLFNIIPKLAKKLSGHSWALLLQNFIKLLIFAIVTIKFTEKHKTTLHCNYNGTKFNFKIETLADLNALIEVFYDEEYNWFPVDQPSVIIDLGAHIGDTAVYYHTHFPNAKIIAVEPSPKNFRRLLENTRQFENIYPVNAAIGSSDGKINLNIQDSSLGHSVLPRERTIDSVQVKLVTLKTLFSNHGISKADIIKFDIEGAEFDLLLNIVAKDFASSYIGEVHEDFSGKLVGELSCVFHKAFDVQIIPLPKKGRYVLLAKTK